ncbi:MAG TPA: amidohydrolase family protein [Vicinamibacteria bacterium]|nr:amidohydrolase family protein [Vicinamibacteria bacterium]
MRAAARRLVLRNARLSDAHRGTLADVALAAGRVAAVEPPGTIAAQDAEADLEGRLLLPGFVNAHDHLDFSTLPALSSGLYRNAYEWTVALAERQAEAAVQAALAVPVADRLFLGGLRNLLAGATAVVHHHAFHRSLARPDFPVRVLARYQFAHSPGLTRELRRTYRTTDRRIPWFIHVGEGTDERSRGEVDLLARENLLRQNTVMIHAIALPAEALPAVAAARASVVWCPEANRRLYGATANVEALRAAGVRVGLGSDGPVSGAGDALSNLAAARAEGVMSDAQLLTLATLDSAEVARLPVGGVRVGDVADLLVADSSERLLAGRRSAVALVLIAGRPRYGHDGLMRALDRGSVPLRVDGEPRCLDAPTGRRASALWRAHPGARLSEWAAGVDPAGAAV